MRYCVLYSFTDHKKFKYKSQRLHIAQTAIAYIFAAPTKIMIVAILKTFFLSISPLGEARLGIPVGMADGLNVFIAFGVGLGGNLLVYPMLTYLIDLFDKKLWKYRHYKKQSVKIMRRAKSGVGSKIGKYGFWGLMVFVMIPLPVTGAYMGTIAAHVLKIERKSAFKAISLGVIVSCAIVAVLTYFSILGIKLV